MLQRKLVVGQTGDRFEQEADRVADRVMAAPGPQVQRKAGCACGGESGCSCDKTADTIRRAPLQISGIGGPLVARAELDIFIPDSAYDESRPEEERRDEAPPEDASLQRDATGAAPSMLGAPQEAAIYGTGAGDPLPHATRADMEGRFGHDFGDVRVHATKEDGANALRLNARAFTVGSDVYFAPGQYRPTAPEGRHLLAHELTHVVQQRGGSHRVQRSEADTLAGCPRYWRYETPWRYDVYNCAGLAWRTYTYRGDLSRERSAVTAGRGVACSGQCNPGEVKHWWWDYDIHVETPSGARGPSNRDFHTVAGVSQRSGADPDDVYTKNGARPVYGPGTGPRWRPPARDRATTNTPSETPANAPDGSPLFKVRSGFNELCACHSCPPRRP